MVSFRSVSKVFAVLIVLVAGLAFAPAVSHAAILVVDDFNDGLFAISVPPAGDMSVTTNTATQDPVDLSLDPANPFGERRTVTIDGTGMGFATAGIFGAGSLQLGTDGGPSGSVFTIAYDDFSDIDLTAGGVFDELLVQFAFIDGSADVTAFVDGVAGQTVSVSGNRVNGLASISLASFATDVTSVSELSFQVTTTMQASDFNINSIAIIPEPASLALLGLGTLLLVRRRR